MDPGLPAIAAGIIGVNMPGALVNESDDIRILHELIEALDRRLPQLQHVGEAGIAREAAALKASALQRLAELDDRSAR